MIRTPLLSIFIMFSATGIAENREGHMTLDEDTNGGAWLSRMIGPIHELMAAQK
jgi:hypothetical protein